MILSKQVFTDMPFSVQFLCSAWGARVSKDLRFLRGDTGGVNIMRKPST